MSKVSPLGSRSLAHPEALVEELPCALRRCVSCRSRSSPSPPAPSRGRPAARSRRRSRSHSTTTAPRSPATRADSASSADSSSTSCTTASTPPGTAPPTRSTRSPAGGRSRWRWAGTGPTAVSAIRAAASSMCRRPSSAAPASAARFASARSASARPGAASAATCCAAWARGTWASSHGPPPGFLWELRRSTRMVPTDCRGTGGCPWGCARRCWIRRRPSTCAGPSAPTARFAAGPITRISCSRRARRSPAARTCSCSSG